LCPLLWHLNEGSGSIAHDTSWNNNHGFLTDVMWTDYGRFDGAATFNGSTSRITVPNSPSLNPTNITVEAWIYPTGQYQDHDIVDKTDSDSISGYKLGFRSEAPFLYFSINVAAGHRMEAVCEDSIGLNQWTHVAGTWDDETKDIAIYVNGELKGTNTYLGWSMALNNHDLVIGRSRDGGGAGAETFDGVIDEVRISNVARTFQPDSSGLHAEFSGGPRSGLVPLEVQFIDLSIGEPISWFWGFGDASSSSASDPTHTYNDTGYFDVKLVVENETHIDSLVKEDYIQVYPTGSVVADFAGTPQFGAVPLEVQFADLSSGQPTSWFWDLGDDSTGSDPNPTHTYHEIGYFDVKLVVENEIDIDSMIKEDYIYVFADTIPFAPGVRYEAGLKPFPVFCADLDGDLDLDLAVGNYRSDDVSILKNNGDGTFQAPVEYEMAPGPQSLFCADLDGDQHLDLATVGEGGLSILKNNGDGTFQVPGNYPGGGYSIFCADLDGDSDLDLAMANGSGVSILENDGDGCFEPKANYRTGSYVFSDFCADLDGDGDVDLVVANTGSDNVSILKNNGDGTFEAKVDYATGNQSRSAFCADLDGDDDLDLAAGHGNAVSILKNNGDGTFQPKIDYPSYGANSVFCADLDGDEDLDLGAGGGHAGLVSVLENNGDGSFRAPVQYSGGGVDTSVFCADLDGDADLDLIATSVGWNKVVVWTNLTDIPGNSPPYPFPLLLPENAAVVCDSMTGTGDSVAYLDWAAAFDPNLSDQIFYDLHISTSASFPPGPETTIDSNLAVTHHVHTLWRDCYYWKVKAKDIWGAETWSTETWHFIVGCGDLTGDCLVDGGDVVFLINYVFRDGPSPDPLEAGDVNEDGTVDSADIVHLINYLFRNGPAPCG
jgi:PKD repeat protein